MFKRLIILILAMSIIGCATAPEREESLTELVTALKLLEDGE